MGNHLDYGSVASSEYYNRTEKKIPYSAHKSDRQWLKEIHASVMVANPNRIGFSQSGSSQVESSLLARQILKVSKCYGVDTGIFTALIWRESNFKPQATSETGAVGLSQMTFYGIHEVLDRLSPQSNRYFKSLALAAQRCHGKFFGQIPETLDLDSILTWKAKVAQNHELALAMGALLLKIHVSRSPLAIRDPAQIYRYALMKYNGDRKVKTRFAEDILFLAKQIETGRLQEKSLVVSMDADSNFSKFLQSIRVF